MVKQGPGMKSLDLLPLTTEHKVKASPQHQLQSALPIPSHTHPAFSYQVLQARIFPTVVSANSIHLKELSQRIAVTR